MCVSLNVCLFSCAYPAQYALDVSLMLSGEKQRHKLSHAVILVWVLTRAQCVLKLVELSLVLC
jgi:hypothetical protein